MRLVVRASFRERLTTLPTFTPESAALLAGPSWLVRRRTAAAEAFLSAALPTEKDEVWRYSRIDGLELDRFHPVGTVLEDADDAPGPSASDRVRALVDGLGPRSGLVVTINGVLATVASTAGDDALSVGRLVEQPDGGRLLGAIASPATDFVLLNDGFALDPILVDIRPGALLDDPIVIVHVVRRGSGSAIFPRTMIRAGASARGGVVELVVDVDAHTGLPAPWPGGDAVAAVEQGEGTAPDDDIHLVVPVTELEVADGALLAYVSVQALGPSTWHLAHQASCIGAEASLSSFAVALGGAYARLRTESALTGISGSSRLRAAYIGRHDQMLDFRTLQDHAAPKTTSDLLFMGAVADRSHSVYSGLIRVRRGAVRSDAMQTNHNLVLGRGAHADSVPNLDIEENDVRCSHASTVGPVDEAQRYYLESRGVEPEMAERLIVAGFFDDIAGQVPIAAARQMISRALVERAGVAGAQAELAGIDHG